MSPNTYVPVEIKLNAVLLEEAFQHRDPTISGLNVRLICLLCACLCIKTPMRFSAEYSPTGIKTERLIDLLRKAGASTYLSDPKARAYLDERLFKKNETCVEYKSYDYAPYPQLWGGFDGACGHGAGSGRELRPWRNTPVA